MVPRSCRTFTTLGFNLKLMVKMEMQKRTYTTTIPQDF